MILLIRYQVRDVILDGDFFVHIGQNLGKTDALYYKVTLNTLLEVKLK
ncbi:hypothetical protein CAL7102_02454 [Dulcicalothrix desertica PCC 7102]|nr:hypothetical protein CAL7102_02454 [Dulcicalothrix desertica PCC 7102]